MKIYLLTIATAVSILATTSVNAKEASECDEYVTLQTIEGNYTITNGPAKIHINGRVLSSPAAIAKGPATLAKNGNRIAFDSPIFGQLQLDMKVMTARKNVMDFTKWNFDGTENDFSPTLAKDLALAMGCDSALKAVRLRGEGSVDLPNVGTVPVTLWLQAIPLGIVEGRMDVVMPPGNLLQTKIHMSRIGPLDYGNAEEQAEQTIDKNEADERDAEQELDEADRAERELAEEIERFERLDLLEDLDDLGVTQRLEEHGIILDPDLEVKVIELKERGYLDSLDMSTVTGEP